MQTLLLLAALSPSPLEEWAQRREKELALPAMRSYWLSLGVLEEHEYYLKNVWSMVDDVATLQWRLEHTKPDWPPLDLIDGLPDSITAAENYTVGGRYRRTIEEMRPYLVDGSETALLDGVIADSQWRSDVWFLLWSIKSGMWTKEGRRSDLNRLRELVGAEAFEKGEWPQPLPPGAYLWDWEVPEIIVPDGE